MKNKKKINSKTASSLKIHSYILDMHTEDIRMLRDRTHDLKSNLEGLSVNVKVIHDSLTEIKKFQTDISSKLDQITHVVDNLENVKKLITSGKFWIFFVWITFIGVIVVIDNFESFKKLFGFN